MQKLPLDPIGGGLWPEPEDRGGIERGTVGWADGSHYDIGTDANDGHLVLHVTLYRGRNHARELKPGVAQGHEILCQVGLVPARIPPLGTAVMVAVPAGLGSVPGASVVFAAVEKNPPTATEFGEDRAVMDLGDATIIADSLKLGDATATAVAIANLVDARISTLQSAFDSHAHPPGTFAVTVPGAPPTVVPVVGASAAPAAPVGPLASVAATKVFAK